MDILYKTIGGSDEFKKIDNNIIDLNACIFKFVDEDIITEVEIEDEIIKNHQESNEFIYHKLKTTAGDKLRIKVKIKKDNKIKNIEKTIKIDKNSYIYDKNELASIRKIGEFALASLKDNIANTNNDYFEMQNALSREIEQLSKRMKNVSCENDFCDLLKHIIQFFGVNHIKAKFPVYNQGVYLCEQLKKFQSYMWIELERTNMNWLLAIENFEGLHSVPIMTIHKSKGLEYDIVYFVGLEDSAFWSFKTQPEEDRCAFFVALSRAKKEIYFTFCNSRNMRKQFHNDINEFFELLQKPGIATVFICK